MRTIVVSSLVLDLSRAVGTARRAHRRRSFTLESASFGSEHDASEDADLQPGRMQRRQHEPRAPLERRARRHEELRGHAVRSRRAATAPAAGTGSCSTSTRRRRRSSPARATSREAMHRPAASARRTSSATTATAARVRRATTSRIATCSRSTRCASSSSASRPAPTPATVKKALEENTLLSTIAAGAVRALSGRYAIREAAAATPDDCAADAALQRLVSARRTCSARVSQYERAGIR